MQITQGVCEMGNSAIPINQLSTFARGGVHRKIQVCSALAQNERIPNAKITSSNLKLCRRPSAETTLQSPNWDFNHVQSLNNEYAAEEYKRRRGVLKEKVRRMLEEEEVEVINRLEFIDTLQRLGISYHFKEKIHSILRRSYPQYRINGIRKQHDLYATALGFRLLRQHGFDVSQGALACHAILSAINLSESI